MNDLDTRRAALVAERDDLEGQLSHLRDEVEGTVDFDENFADSGQVAAEKGESRALLSSLEERLADVATALTRLDEGSYGRCERCGDEIGAARLEAFPTAVRCMQCAA